MCYNNSSCSNGTMGPYDDMSGVLLWREAVYYMLISIATLGIFCNIGIFVWLLRFSSRQRHSSSLSLMAMCIADCVCLLFLLIYNCLAELVLTHADISIVSKTWFCKVVMFSIHTCSTFSVWCWMILAGLRFLAIFMPVFYTQYRVLHKPERILAATFIILAGTESWLLVATIFRPYSPSAINEGDCDLSKKLPRKAFETAELTLNFILPVIMTVIMDTIVRFCVPSSVRRMRQHYVKIQRDASSVNAESLGVQITNLPKQHYRGPAQKHRRSLRRYLLLALLDVILNTPTTLFRLYHTFALYKIFKLDAISMVYVMGIAHLMYYAQFGINVLYIWVLVGPKNTNNKEATSITQMGTTGQQDKGRRRYRKNKGKENGNDSPLQYPIERDSKTTVHMMNVHGKERPRNNAPLLPRRNSELVTAVGGPRTTVSVPQEQDYRRSSHHHRFTIEQTPSGNTSTIAKEDEANATTVIIATM